MSSLILRQPEWFILVPCYVEPKFPTAPQPGYDHRNPSFFRDDDFFSHFFSFYVLRGRLAFIGQYSQLLFGKAGISRRAFYFFIKEPGLIKASYYLNQVIWKKHILLIDDGEANWEYFMTATEPGGDLYTMDLAADAEQAIIFSKYIQPDFIFVD